MKKLNDWLEYAQNMHPSEIDLGLDRVKEVAVTCDLTGFSCPVIMIGGTNGKGSCVAVIESILLSAGYRVAAYTSPHFFTFNERCRINGQSANTDALCKSFEYIESKRADVSLTFFELTTLACFHHIAQQQVDFIILEVGLGGRLDAVNIIDADISVITSVSLDHQDYLGPDRESIGREKAGIIREKSIFVCGDPSPPESIKEIAKQQNAASFYYGHDYGINQQHSKRCWEWFAAKIRIIGLTNSYIKQENIATSLMVISLINRHYHSIDLVNINRGIKQVSMIGRAQRLCSQTDYLFDVAHNPASASALANKLQQLPKTAKTYAVFSILAGKDIYNTIKPLLGLIDAWFIAGLNEARAATLEQIEQQLAAHHVESWYTFASIEEAFEAAADQAKTDDRVVVFGSFYTVGKTLTLLHKGVL